MQLVRHCTAHILAIEGILMRQTGACRSSGYALKRMTVEQVEALGFVPDVALAVQANRAVSAVLQQQIAVLEQRLKERVSLHPDYRLLRTVPGIGEVLATTIMRAHLCDLNLPFEWEQQESLARQDLTFNPGNPNQGARRRARSRRTS